MISFREPLRRRQNTRKQNTSEINRVKITTASATGLTTNEIVQKYGFSGGQVYYALRNSSNPKISGNEAESAISQNKAKSWSHGFAETTTIGEYYLNRFRTWLPN